jgi:hypothetical protein
MAFKLENSLLVNINISNILIHKYLTWPLQTLKLYQSQTNAKSKLG